MRRGDEVRRLFRLPGSESSAEADVSEELAFHLEERARTLVERGMDEEAARAEALREFGDLAGARMALGRMARDRVRRRRRSGLLQDLGQDLRYGVRAAQRAPLFSLLAIVTLALGIGANAAVFGVLKSVLLDALPYGDPDRLLRVYGQLMDGSVERGAVSAGTVDDLRRRQRSFGAVAAFALGTDVRAVGGDDGRPQLATLGGVEPEFFRTLGVAPRLGRDFLPEDAPGDTIRYLIASHEAWQRLFGGAPDILERRVVVDGIPRTIVGVLPEGYVAPTVGSEPVDLYYPLTLEAVLASPVSARGSHWLGAIGRLRDGVSVEAGRQDVEAIGRQLAEEFEENASIRVFAVPLRESMAGDTRTPLLVLMASAALVLLIACANLAGALLSRTLSRRREFAVRASLGAGSGRIIRQLLTESVLLALVGGAAGVMLAVLGLDVLRGLAAHALPEYADLSLDAGAIVLMGLVALLAGVIFGLAPALAVGRVDLQGTLREESRGASEGQRSQRLRGALVAGQIALCVSLLAGAALLTRSLWEMTRAPLGFDARRVLTLATQLPELGYPTAESWTRFQDQYLERLRSLPGVEAAASVTRPPTAADSRMGLSIEGRPQAANATPFVLYAVISDDYFRTLGIPLRQGRSFDARDRADAPPAVIISEAMARRHWPDGNALGARIRLGPNPNSPLIEVIGIAGDVRNDPTRPDAEPMAYRSIRQAPWPTVSFLARTSGDPEMLTRAAETELAKLDPALPVERPTPLAAVVGNGFVRHRLPTVLLAAFGAIALVLATVGVYAMFAAMAAARTTEFAIRMALGSTRADVARLVLRQGGAWMVAGLVAGLAGVIIVARLVEGWLFGVVASDPIAIGAAIALLLACATTALLVPVRRATGVDPATALHGP